MSCWEAFTSGSWASYFGGESEVTDISRACKETARLGWGRSVFFWLFTRGEVRVECWSEECWNTNQCCATEALLLCSLHPVRLLQKLPPETPVLCTKCYLDLPQDEPYIDEIEPLLRKYPCSLLRLLIGFLRAFLGSICMKSKA